MYETLEELPEQVTAGLSPEEAEKWRLAFNGAEEDGSPDPDREAWKVLLDEGEEDAFGYLVDLAGLELADVPEGKSIRRWIHALPSGKAFEHPIYGKIEITPARVKRFAKHVNDGVRGIELDIDYEHKRSVQGGKAAGWVKKARASQRGLELLVEFNPPAVTALKNGEYRYFSPEYRDRWCHEETKKCYDDVLFGGALTNRPFLKGLAPINLSEVFPVAKKKFAQEDARYREADSSTYRCSNCAFFDGKSSCLLVEGEVDPNYVSVYFKPIYNRNRGSLLEEEITDAEVHEYRDIPQGERKKSPAGDFAWPETRSFPILRPEDVTAAARAMGRLKSPTPERIARLKANIIRIAKRKGWASRLPESWRKLMDEFLKKLAEALGLKVELSDEPTDEEIETAEKSVLDKVAEVIKASEKEPEPEGDPEPEGEEEKEAAKKFAEEFPEEAERLKTLEEENRGHRIAARVKVFEETSLRPTRRAIAPAHREKLQGLLMKLSEDHAGEVVTTFAEMLKDGIVDLSERGSDNGQDQDATERIAERAEKLMEEAEKEGEAISYRDALDKAMEEDPEAAKAHIRSRQTISGDGEE